MSQPRGSVPCRSFPAGSADLPFSGPKWAELCICLVLLFLLCLLGPLYCKYCTHCNFGGQRRPDVSCWWFAGLPFWVWEDLTFQTNVLCNEPTERDEWPVRREPSVHEVERPRPGSSWTASRTGRRRAMLSRVCVLDPPAFGLQHSHRPDDWITFVLLVSTHSMLSPTRTLGTSRAARGANSG